MFGNSARTAEVVVVERGNDALHARLAPRLSVGAATHDVIDPGSSSSSHVSAPRPSSLPSGTMIGSGTTHERCGCGDGLHGLPQPHLVADERAAAVRDDEAHALALERVQRRSKPARDGLNRRSTSASIVAKGAIKL